MHHPPDLSLASSYIPACLCVLKCTGAFVLFIFSPVRGWIGLISALLTDRILWNKAADSTILDVNAVCVALVGGLMVMHARAEGIKTLAHFAITGIWILLSSLQILGATRLHRAYEVLFAACSVSVMSCLYQAQERTELLALRSFIFVVANATLPYMGVMLQYSEIDTYINACRTLLILLGEPEIASAWIVVYILCIGYQIRNTSSPTPSSGMRRGCSTPKFASHPYYGPAGELYENEAYSHEAIENGENCCPSQPVYHPTPASLIKSTSIEACQSGTSKPPDEATLLREALANRKGFRDA